MPNDPRHARFLVVGLGSIGRRHLANLRGLRPDADIAVLRSSGRAAPKSALRTIDREFVDIKEALEFSPEVAVICSPASLHLEHALALAGQGAHLFIEKPLAAEFEPARQACEQLQDSGRVVMVGYNFRFSPSLLHARTLLAQGAIGEVLSVRAEVGQYLPDWRPGEDLAKVVSAKRSLGGGALLELSHEIDFLCWLFGLPEQVTARGGKLSDLDIDVEDTVELILEYPKRPLLVNIHLDMLQRTPHRSCRFIGELGTIEWNALEAEVRIYQAQDGVWQLHTDPSWADPDRVYVDEMAHFLDCVDSDTSPRVGLRDGINALQVVDAARRSMSEARTVLLGDGK